MAITKTIEIDGIAVHFRASAAIPRLYRMKFGRDVYKDLAKLQSDTRNNNPECSEMSINSLEVFEDLAWLMAHHADPENVPDTPDEWLEEFNTFSIYEILPQLIELWGLNIETQVESKKNIVRLTGK